MGTTNVERPSIRGGAGGFPGNPSQSSPPDLRQGGPEMAQAPAYFFLAADDLAATAEAFCLLTAWVLVCFCVAFLFVDLGDLSPMMIGLS